MTTIIEPQYPQLEQIAKKKWKLLADVRFEYEATKYVTPAEFVTDGASVPRLFWPIMPPLSNYTNAAVVHDWIYKTHCIDSRSTADRVFLEGMAHLGVARWKRRVMWSAVRTFGGLAWRAKR